jgi:hypothetical protein
MEKPEGRGGIPSPRIKMSDLNFFLPNIANAEV